MLTKNIPEYITYNPPAIIIKKQKIIDYVDKILLPLANRENWFVLKKEFEYLDYLNIDLFILFKNNKPIGHYIETNFKETVCLSNLIIISEERRQGYAELLLEQFVNSHKNLRICAAGVPHMCEYYDRKLNLKKIKKSFNCNLEFDRKSMKPIKKLKLIDKLKYTEENLAIVDDCFSNWFGYQRLKAAEYFLKYGNVFLATEESNKIGILCATIENNKIRINNLIADSIEVALDLFYSFLWSLPEEKFIIYMSIPQNDKFMELIILFRIKIDENNFLWILDTNLNCTYDNFYCISEAII